jgi:hypothetical protein
MGSGPTQTTNTNQKQDIDSTSKQTGTNAVQGTSLVQGSQIGGSQTAGQTQGVTGSYQANNAYAPTEPVLQNIITQAQQLSGGGQQPALSGIEDQATRNAALNPQIEDAASYMLSGAGFGDGDAMVREGYDSLKTGLQKTADGYYLDQQNPYLQGMLSGAMDDAQNMIGAQFANAGRSFSGAHRDATAAAMTNAALPTLFQNYQFERDKQLGAAQGLASGGNAASGALGANRSGAAGAMQAAPGMLDTTYNPYSTMLNAPIDSLSKISSLIMPIASGFGEQVGLGSQAGSTAGQQVEGQQSSQLTENDILTMLNSLTKTQGTTTGTGTSTTQQQNDPLSMLLGAGTMLGGAALGNPAIFSDRRLKSDIEKIGETFDGQSIYRYRYNGSRTVHIGLMADEVEKIEPEAVTTTPEGIKMVHYGLATERAAELGRAH